jgi:hypothetical protein
LAAQGDSGVEGKSWSVNVVSTDEGGEFDLVECLSEGAGLRSGCGVVTNVLAVGGELGSSSGVSNSSWKMASFECNMDGSATRL